MKIIITDDGKTIGVDIYECGETKPATKEIVGILECAKFAILSQKETTPITK